MAKKKKVSFTFSETAAEMLKGISEKQGLSMASCLEVLIREKAAALGIAAGS